MGRPRYRSASGGSLSEISSSHSPQALKAARELFNILIGLRNASGKTFLHSVAGSDNDMGLAQALLQRATQLDHVASTGIVEQLLLAQDLESGYTPLHCAMMERNLAMVLQILRHAANSNESDGVQQPRLAQRPMQLLEGDVAAKTCISKIVMCRDYEGLNPLDLLCRLQRTELTRCRQSLSANMPAGYSTLHNRRGESVGNEFHVLQEPGLVDLFPRQNITGVNNVGCEVLTFGRVNHCALGGGRGSLEKHAGSNLSSQVRPQRVQAFALSHLGKDQSAVAVAAASHHTLVASRNGRLYAFGLGKGGRLGTGNERHCPVPTRVMGPLTRRRVVAIAAAENHSMCVSSDGIVYAWGSNRFGQLGSNSDDSMSNDSHQRCLPRRVDLLKQVFCVSVAAGDRHSVALSNQGEVYTWGDNQAGQLGITLRGGSGGASGKGSPSSGGGQQVNRVDALWAASPRRVAMAISAAAQSTLVLTYPPQTAASLPTNTVFSWGHGNHVPIKVNFSSDAPRNPGGSNLMGRGHVNPVAISCAKYHNAAVTADGRVFTWGLHAEPLGTKAKHSSSRSMVIASPQVVTGMLPENGGGTAVAISACENHTAVLTDCGNLYTWGATYGKDVLGHEGVRWQPSPKKVPGVYRAVGVAAAKEHTVLLVGTSFPPIAAATPESCPSLESLAARSVAKHVDLFNVIPILVIAERTSCSFLIDFCQEFIRLNLDGVLTLGKKSEMDRYLNDKLADGAYNRERYEQDASYHPLLFDIVGSGASSDLYKGSGVHSWIESCEGLLDRLPISLMSKHRATVNGGEQTPQLGRTRRDRGLSFSGETVSSSTAMQSDELLSESAPAKQAGFQGCSERCMMLTANMSVTTADSARLKYDCLSKEVRSVRKRLNQIAKLEQTGNELQSLSSEQRDKLARRPLLEIDLGVLQKALLQVEDKMHSLGLTSETKRFASLVTGTDQNVVEEEPVVSKEFIDEKETKAVAPGADDAPSSFRCEVCQISCPDANSFALHKNGRKHRNRVSQAEDQDRKDTAASMMEMKRRQLIMTEPERPKPKPSPWQTKDSIDHDLSVQPKYKLPPPPVFPSPERKARPSPASAKTSESWCSSIVPPPKRAVGAKKSSSFRTILEEEEATAARGHAKVPSKSRSQFQSPSAKTTSPWAQKTPLQRSSPVARIPHPIPLASTPTAFSLGRGASDSACASKKSSSLGDFLVSPNAVRDTRSPVVAPWVASPAANIAAKALATSPPSSKSFLDIQREEQDMKTREDQSCGLDGHWYVQQRERAGSISRIQEEEAKVREHKLLVEEQKRIEEEIMRDLEQQKQKERKGKSKRNRKPKKKQPQQKQSDSDKKQNAQKGGNDGKETKKKQQQQKPADANSRQTANTGGNDGKDTKTQSKSGGDGKNCRRRKRNTKNKPSSGKEKAAATPGKE